VDDSDLPRLSQEFPLDGKGWCTPAPKALLPTKGRWSWVKTHSSAVDWVRVHVLVKESEPGLIWSLAIKAEDGTDVQDIQSSDLDSDDLREGIWTARIPGNEFHIELISDTKPSKLMVCLDSYSVKSIAPDIESKAYVDGIHDRSIPLLPAHPFYKYTAPVAVVEFIERGAHGNKETNCTGFLITESLLLTNNHCISTDSAARNASARLNYEVRPTRPEIKVRFSKLVMTDQNLDFTVLRIAPTQSHQYVARIDENQLAPNEALVLVQHPLDNPKKIATQKEGCVLQDASAVGVSGETTDFYHLCDSTGGSSGSPVFRDIDGQVVGLHHLGRYDPSANSYHNLAVKMVNILKKIHDSNAALYNEIKASQTELGGLE
jgi:V8-like Glu-specific endopeptidase